MRVLVSGATGLIGAPIVQALEARGEEVTRLMRGGAAGADVVSWDADSGRILSGDFGPFDAVIHLAGESIASGRWTKARKNRIRDSRVIGTRNVCHLLAAQRQKPRALLCASAIGYYGSRGAEILTEDSPPGTGFLAEVCREWEAATAPAREAGIRVVNMRFGAVLSRDGGALAKMLTPFKLGLGGVVGDGQQYMSWIASQDVTAAVLTLLSNEEFCGPVNVVAPNPVSNRVFTKTLATVLRRPALFPLPAPVARLALGEMADALLLASARVAPKRLTEAGFVFEFPRLDDALNHILRE